MTYQTTAEIIRDRLRSKDVRFFACDNISEHIAGYEKQHLVDEVENAFKGVLKALVIDTENDPNSKGTARRLAKMYINEIMSGRYEASPEVTTFPNVGPDSYTGMIVIRAEIKSVCAHHWQPITGTSYIGIIPNGNVMGLSKYIRIAQWCASRGTLQEELCNDIAQEISFATGTNNVAVYIAAEHGCCTNRGVNAHSALTQTTVLKGEFISPDVKKEFFDNIQLQEMHSKTR